ncbi:MAG: DinB family protein [Anaerolineae bacterium]
MAGSEQARQLADRFSQLNDEVMAFVTPLTDEQWDMICGDDERPVGIVAHHIATAYSAIAGWLVTLADGKPLPPLTMEMLNAVNDAHAQQHAGVSKADTLDLLKRNGEDAVAKVAGFTDAQLGQTDIVWLLGGATLTTAQLADAMLIGHTGGHLDAMRVTLGR